MQWACQQYHTSYLCLTKTSRALSLSFPSHTNMVNHTDIIFSLSFPDNYSELTLPIHSQPSSHSPHLILSILIPLSTHRASLNYFLGNLPERMNWLIEPALFAPPPFPLQKIFKQLTSRSQSVLSFLLLDESWPKSKITNLQWFSNPQRDHHPLSMLSISYYSWGRCWTYSSQK